MKRLKLYILFLLIAMCAVTSAQSQAANPATVKSGVARNQVRFSSAARVAGFTSAPSAGHSDSAPARPAWTLLFPQTTIPASRFTPSAAYDAPTNSLILFGGASDSETSNPTINNDVLSLSNANGNGANDWTTVIPDNASGSPPPRVYPTGVYDAANSRLIIFGGCTVTGDACTTTLNDVWVLSNANGVSGTPTWTQLTPSGSLPSTRWRHAAAYDPANNRMIIYGGDDRLRAFFSDVWVLSNANGLGGTPVWTQLSPSGGPPIGQDSPSVVYDSVNNILTEFAGGKGLTTATNSVWILSNADGLGGTPVWTNLIANRAAGSPPKREGHIAVYDATNNRMMIFGGTTATGFPDLNDAWVLLNANGIGGKPQWSKVKPAGTKPIGRDGHVGVYDSADNRLIIYGGGSMDAESFATWTLTGANGLP